MKQVFILGSSSTYGVGGENGGWADLLKQSLHSKMYSDGGVGEKYEVYNFAKSGAPISFVKETSKEQFKNYKRSGKTIVVVSVGGNNSKAEDKPDNYVSTIEEYEKEMTELLTELKKNSDAVIFVGGSAVDELKTNPKPNPLTGGKSYFTNNRRAEFENALRGICAKLDVTFVDVGVSPDEWKEKYLFEDGLHPNRQGHEFIFKKVLSEVRPLLD